MDFVQRNALFDESLEVMRMIWTGESVNYQGLNFSIADSTGLPTPVQSPVPVWIGGNSKLSRRRVAEKAQGWMPMPNPAALSSRRRSAHLETLDELAEMIAYLFDHAVSVSRSEPIDVKYMDLEVGAVGSPSWNPDQHLESIASQAAIGVTVMAAPISGDSRSQVVDALHQYGEEIIAYR